MSEQRRVKNHLHGSIVHLCTFEAGGAARAAHRLHRGLKTLGVDSTFLVAGKCSNDPGVYAIPPAPNSFAFDNGTGDPLLWDTICQRWGRLLAQYPSRPSGLEIFSDTSSSYHLTEIKKIADSEIIHLHWVAGLLNYPEMSRAFAGKKLVWTLHDMNPFTGGCHYSGTCDRYTQSCGDCPQLGSNDGGDLSRRIWEEKYRALECLDISVVTPSRWLARCAAASSLLSRFPVSVIPYGVPTDIFRPYPKSDVRRHIGLPENAKVILFGADDLSNERKGFKYLLRAMSQFSPNGNTGQSVLAVFGNSGNRELLDVGYPIVQLGYLETEEKMALAYNLADVYVLPSMEDNLPNTLLEAMSCGVPVVGFDVGGMPDVIEHHRTGYLAPAGNVEGLVEGIEWCLFNDEYQQISTNCRTTCLTRYTPSVQAKAYDKLYARAITGGSTMMCLRTDRDFAGTSPMNGITPLASCQDHSSEDRIQWAIAHVKSHPHEVPAYLDVARILDEAGQTEKALHILGQAARVFPADRTIPPMIAKLRGENARAPQPALDDSGDAFWIATSLAPGNLERQRRAVRSWQELGFRIASLNSPDEIRTLAPQFSGVTFRAAHRDARAETGRPLVYFDDILEMLSTLPGNRYGIVNSDIELRGAAMTREEISALTADALVFGHRINIDNPDDTGGSREVNGHDFFFFPRQALTVFPKTPLCIGGPWWDYWVLMMPMLRGIPLVRWEGPLGFHVKHAERWDMEIHRRFGAWTRHHYVRIAGEAAPNDPNVPLGHSENLLFALDMYSTIARKARSHFPNPVAAPASVEPLWWTAEKDVSSEDDLLLELPRRRPQLVKQVRTLYVVGAHLFQEEALFRKMFPNLERIVLFEPIPSIVAQLRARIADRPDVTLVPCAIGDRDGKALFHITDNFASSSLLPMKKHREIFPWVREKERVQVEVHRLETVMRDLALPAPDLLFLDVQGAEYQILSSLSRELLSALLGIYTETSTDELYEGARNLSDIQELLGDLFELRGFAPLNNQVRNHGNSIFLRRQTPHNTHTASSAPAPLRIAPLVTVAPSFPSPPPPAPPGPVPKLEPDGHFYSPLVDPTQLRAREAQLWSPEPSACGIDFNPVAHREFFQHHAAAVMQDYDYPRSRPPDSDQSGYWEENIMFIDADARAYFTWLRRLMPSRLIEVGSGFSTRLADDVNRRFLGGRTRIECIEPYDQEFLRSPPAGVIVHRAIAQDVPPSYYAELGEGDILFIDSSHVLKTGSDVQHLYLKVLPALRRGTIVHIHDIFLPYEYPKDWVLRDGRHWNEQYLVQAILELGDTFEVLYGSAYAHWKFPIQLTAFCGGRHSLGGSLWLRKRR